MSDTPLAATDKAALTNRIATIASDPLRTTFGGRLLPEDSVLASRGGQKGLAIYEDLERDGKVGTVLQKRRLALVSREWSVDAGEETPAAEDVAELVRDALNAIAFDEAVGDLLGALSMGVAVLEVVWEVRGNALVPARLVPVDPRRVAFHDAPDGQPELRLLTRASPLDGEVVPPRKFIAHRCGGRYGNPWGLGLGHRLFWPVFFKRQGVSFWLGALEKFGQPTVLGRYSNGTPEDQQQKLLKALQAIASDAGVAIPEGMEVELIEAQRAGSFDSYEKLCRYMDEEIAQIVLGETLTTSTGANGNRALGEVHDGVRLELTKADGDQLSGTLSGTLIRWIIELNRPGYAGKPPRLWWDVTEPEDLNKRAERDGKVQALGYEAEEDYVRTTYGEGWTKKAPPPPPPPGPRPMPPGLAAAFAEALPGAQRSAMPPADDGRDAPQELAQQLDQVSLPMQEAMVARVAALVDSAESLPALAAGLAELYQPASDAAFAELLGDALTLAALRGRADLAEEAG